MWEVAKLLHHITNNLYAHSSWGDVETRGSLCRQVVLTCMSSEYRDSFAIFIKRMDGFLHRLLIFCTIRANGTTVAIESDPQAHLANAGIA